jgi:hypothetical protein
MTSAPVKLTRERFKAAREGRPYDPPATHAARIVKLLEPAARSNPAPVSRPEEEFVRNRFTDTYLGFSRARSAAYKARGAS